nr:protein disulfide isomerase 1 (PDI1) [Polytomella parva]|mmetsp:Transcript_13310/g.23569  ORF Transcript_13310/g.23569 Transcript_13310/m.23569 type:complete len:509 (-) Transcript_13310:542-2068(-)|eukprot:CAMPEP_0175050518 /NCGR_PEP_ID=MMETSP0052_2-20121109/7303_1 /TAXON_ID=51329 ORGANISM="Polytomella parva, Strain SAG 63-3" /NCGR_SAMPLE_ID=MMETSP0052_2 /ASSEMBLY_ACC=CAM_ASM_000194 /LENGTH=508 /DNA_ID=CAMNT_0016314729 /DNA_START=161 /DNA_END=1687 /DNA_ORIENTATION=+
MKRSNFILTFLALLLVASPFVKLAFAAGGGADEIEVDESNVVVLTSKNFKSVVGSSPFALVEFYAPWCGHCKTLKPHYAKAATELKEKDSNVVLAKVDATEEAELASQFEVKGYPTLKWFVNGEMVSDYNGGRDAAGIVSWVNKKSGPAAVTVSSPEELKDLESTAEVIVLGYFGALEGAVHKLFMSVAQKIESVAFAQTTDAETAANANIDAVNGISIIKNFPGESREVVSFAEKDLDEEILQAFVDREKLPLTIEFNQKNGDKIFNSGIKKQVILWASPSDLAFDSPVYQAFRAVAKTLKGKVVFVTTDNEGSGASAVGGYFGLAGQPGPKVVGFEMEANKKFNMPSGSQFSQDSVAAFAMSILEGTAEVEYKSAPIPSSPKDGHVTIVVGKNFDEIVKDSSKDVLLEVYAPWCTHCKKLEPSYKKLAKRFASIDSVVIAKMDGTENEHPDVEVKGFPTILLFPAGQNKQPIAFSGGERNIASLTKFIKQNAQSEFQLPKKAKEEL